MIEATYFIVRYMPDLARGEYRNIGVIIHGAGQTLVSFDSRSYKMVFREAPSLDVEAFSYIEEDLISELERKRPRDISEVLEFIDEELHGGFSISPPGKVYIDLPSLQLALTSPESVRAELTKAIEHLKQRLTRPLTKRSYRRASNVKSRLGDMLIRSFSPDEVFKDHQINRTRSGIHRAVDFFVNHQTDVAVEIINLPLNATENAALHLADQILGMANDILAGGQVKHLVAYLPSDAKSELRDQEGTFRAMLSPDARISFTNNMAEAVDDVLAIASRHAAD